MTGEQLQSLAKKTGSVISPFIWVVYQVKHDGKQDIRIGNFQVDRHATDEDIIAGAEKDIDKFYAYHLPDGTPRPRVVNFQRGALRLVMDD